MPLLALLALACHHPAPADTSDTDADSDTSAGDDTQDTVTDDTDDTDTGPPLGASIDDLVGVDAFIDDPVDKLAVFGNVREYHNWDWNDQSGPAYPDEALQWSLWSGYWDWDAYYAGLVSEGVDPFPAVQGSVASLGWANPPVPGGAALDDPASYVAHASYLFQCAARYGATAVPDGELKLADGQTRTSGLDLVHDYEDGNETDANWTTGDGSWLFEPGEYAAMASADRDGDQGRLAGVGVRTADPTARLVMAGLAGAGPSGWVSNVTSYLDGVKAWSDAHRGGELPVDVLNVHHYCFGPGGGQPGVAPEACGLADDLRAVAAWRDANAPGMPLWLTEVGYDTDQGSPVHAPPIGSASAQAVQGQWLVRSLLAAAEGGVDRVDVYMSRDVCSDPDCAGHDVQFSTSGLMTEKGRWEPKTSYWYLATFRSALAGTRFETSVDGGDVRVDRFRGDVGAGYVLWSPTSAAVVVSGYQLDVGGATSATLVRLVDGTEDGERTSLPIEAGTVVLDVDETPEVVLVDR